MSTIYEALRKAEERRRLGEAPALIGDAAWATRRPPHAAPSRRLWAWLLLPAVLAGLAGAWWLGRGSGAAPPVPTAAAPAPAPAAAAATSTATAPASGSTAPAPVAVAPAQAVVANNAATPVAPAAAPAAPIPAGPDDLAARDGVPAQKLAQFERGEVFANAPELLRPVTPTPPAPPPPAEAALPQPLAEASAPPAAPVAVVAPTALPSAMPAATPASAPVPVPLPPVAAPPAAVQKPAGAPAPPGASAGVPLIYELPLGTRQTLPTLRMSMHVYSADAARRVVILDGERYQEGATVSGELRVAAITPDGVVLELGGQRFLLPRSGR